MPFSNPIVAGNTLVRDAIQSEGFVTGVTGWSIQRNGNAEFNDVAIRGTVEISGAGGTLRLIVDILGQPQIEFITSGGDNYRINADVDSFNFGFNNLAGRSSIHIVKNEGIAFRSSQTGAPSVLFDDNTGRIKAGSFSPWTEENWSAPTYTTPAGVAFANLTNYEPGGYKIFPDGLVHLKGAIARSAATGDDLVVFTLPAKYRPAARRAIPVASLANLANTQAGCHIRIYEAGHATVPGAVSLFGFSATNPTAFSLDGCTFNLI